MKSSRSTLLVCAFVLITVALGAAQYAPANAEWARPVEPFRIIGNIYYVGTKDVSTYLITSASGHILLDAGFRESASAVQANVEKLGFRVADIRLLLASHAHYDHVGGLAEIKAKSNAHFLANPRDKRLFEQGGKGDFAFADRALFPAVRPDGKLADGEEIRVGDSILVAHFTPGHTKGCTTYSTRVREGERTYDVVFPCSLSTPGYKLVNNELYPEIVPDYEASFKKLRGLKCDVFMGGHSWDFGLDAKRKALESGTPGNPFVDPQGYQGWIEKSEAAFRAELRRQQLR